MKSWTCSATSRSCSRSPTRSSDTQHAPRPLRPFRAVVAVALAAVAIFVLVLASPWDRGGGGSGSVLDRALAAIDSSGPVTHMTMRLDVTRGGRTVPSIVMESFYDKRAGLVRVVSRSEGKVLGDYTTAAAEDEFSFFPGLLEGAAFYKQALANGDARIVGQGVWRRSSRLLGRAREGRRTDPARRHRPRQLPAGGLSRAQPGRELCRRLPGRRARLRLRVRSDRPTSTRPPRSSSSGRVVGPDCRPIKARVDAFLGERGERLEPSAEIASARTGPDGSFALDGRSAEEPVPRGSRQRTAAG